MMESLRKWAGGWVAFILIGLLILSFAIWGVADVFTGGQYGAVATVGDQEISEEEFRRAFQTELGAISRQAGQRITLDQARSFGLDQRVLSRLVGASAIEAHATELNLKLSDEAIADGFKRDPSFQGSDGQFYRPLLDTVMRQLGVSEQGLIDMRRRDEMREHITTALLRSAVVPEPMIDNLFNFREEKRVISHFQIDPDKVLKLDAPTDEQLKETYEANKSRYMTPERRNFSALVLSRASVEAAAPITDEQIKTAYEGTKSRYDKPEKRVIQQLAFPDLAAAQAAKTAIDGGKDFMEVAKENGAKETDVNLGVKTKDELIDPKIAEAAFTIEGGKVSDPVEGRFTTVLLRVTNIVAGEESTLESAKEQVRKELAREYAIDQLRVVYDKVDEGLSEARSLKDIGDELGLRHFEIKDADRDNKKPNKSLALDVVNADAVVASVFAGEVGVEQEAVQLSDGGYAWANVEAITAPKLKPFNEVEAEVKEQWITDSRRLELSKIAAKYVDRIRSGEALSTLAAEAGGTVATSEPSTRGRVPDGLTQAAVSQAFVLPEGRGSSSESSDGKSRIVFRVDDIVPAGKPNEEQTTAIRNELMQQLRGDQISVYLAALESRFGVNINQRIVDRVTGASAATP